MQNYFTPDIETASRDYLTAIQSARLIKMVENCYKHVPFYKQKFDEIGLLPGDIKSIADITKLPFTIKQDLRDNYPFGLFAVPKEKLVRVHASSGTTGKQTVVGYTKHDISIWSESAARALSAAGATKGDYIHISYGYGLFTGGLGLHYAAEKLGATAIPVSSGNTNRQMQILQDFGSDIICCTPSYAMYIGESLKAAGVDSTKLPLRVGIFGAEAGVKICARKSKGHLISKLMIFTVFQKLQDPASLLNALSKTVCILTKIIFIPRLLILIRLKFCRTEYSASLCLRALGKKLFL